MQYRDLISLFYSDKENYAKEYLNRFNSEEAVKLDFNIGRYQAFFLQNSQVMTLAFEIEKLDKQIEKMCVQLPNIALQQYSKRCLIDEIVLTNKIEGVHSSRKEIGEVLDTLETQSKTKDKHIRMLGLVNKYLKLSAGEKIPLQNCKDIRNLYDEIVLDEVVYEDASNVPDGTIFRKESVSVHSETDKEIHRGLMPESKIIEAMKQSLDFLNDDSVEGLFRISLFHYLLEYIHPFYDGNGRLGRLIFSYGISQNLCPLVALRISETIKENISEYYKAFKTCNDQRNLGDLTPFLLMQLNMIRKAMSELKSSLEEKQATWDKYEGAIEKMVCDPNTRELYSILIQSALFSETGISMRELTASMLCSPYTINKLLSEINAGMIVIKKKGNTKYYSFNLDALNDIILRATIETLPSEG